MLQNVFQSFFVTAERPQLGLAMTTAELCAFAVTVSFLMIKRKTYQYA